MGPIWDEELIKRFWGWAGVFVGALVTKVGFGRLKRRKKRLAYDDDTQRPTPPGRLITSAEWHDLRDKVNRVLWELDAIRRGMEGDRAAQAKDHDRLSTAIVELAHVNERLRALEDGR